MQYKVIDKKKLDLAMTEYFKGLKKPYLKSYANELLEERLSYQFNKISNFYEYCDKFAMCAASSITNLSTYCNIARIVTFNAQKNYLDGNKAETKKTFKNLETICKADD